MVCLSVGLFFSLQLIHQNPLIVFICLGFLVSHLGSGVWSRETFLRVAPCNGSESSADFQKTCVNLKSKLISLVYYVFVSR